MKILYIDMPSGISGDMTLGAFLDAGVPESALREGLARFGMPGYKLTIASGEKGGITGTHVDVEELDEASSPHQHAHDHDHDHEHGHTHEHDHEHTHEHDREHDHEHTHEHDHDREHGLDHVHDHEHPHPHDHEHPHPHAHGHPHAEAHTHVHRNWRDIRAIIEKSGLLDEEKRLAIRIFQRVADAEGRIHGKPADEVGFHEVGAVDSIVDIVGAAICMHWLHPDKVVASAVNTGSGFVRCQHGLLPVPAPATAAILMDGEVPVYAKGSPGERTTPTGAAIVAEFADSFGVLPAMVVRTIGYGVGTKDFDSPNVLRMIVGDEGTSTEDEVTVLEANMDDMTGEAAGFLLGKLLDAGARDAFYIPVQMKKNRPGMLLSVITTESRVQALETLIFSESSTIGIRRSVMKRSVMARRQQVVKVAGCDISIKVSQWRDIVKGAPEYEDVRIAAEKTGLPFRAVYRMAEAAFDAERSVGV